MNCSLVHKSSKDKARDFWVLIYLCNGLNVKDILSFKHQNIQDQAITVIRAKTRGKLKASSRPITIPLTSEVKILLEKWANYGQGDEYLFEVLEKSDTPLQVRTKVQNFTRFINKNMAKICKEIGIRKKVTTYSARHSFSTILRNNGVPVEYISEALGHVNLETTKLYLDDFDSEHRLAYSKHLIK